MPKGYVCDKCNNEVLSGLDSALLKFEPIAFLQVLFVPYTKGGKLPEANFQNIFLKRANPRKIVITPKDKTGRIKNKKHLGDNWYSFNIETRGKQFNSKLLGRALYKIALGMVALSQGHGQACSRKYDTAREFIRNGQGIQNNLLICMKNKPHPEVCATYYDLPEGTPFVIDIFGLIFVLNLENNPILELNEILIQSNFELYSLYS